MSRKNNSGNRKRRLPKGNKSLPRPLSNSAESRNSELVSKVSTVSDKSKWSLVKNTSAKVWAIYAAAATITGFTLTNFFPDSELNLIPPTDRPQIILELKNNSWVKMDTVAYSLYVLSIHTLEGDDIDSVIMSPKYIRDAGLKKSEVQPIEIDLNNYFFHYSEPPHFFSAKLAVVIHSEYFGFRQDNTFYFESINDYHGGHHWVKMPEQNFVEAMKKSKNNAGLKDLPFMRHLLENGDTNMGEGVMPPPEILKEMRRPRKYEN